MPATASPSNHIAKSTAIVCCVIGLFIVAYISRFVLLMSIIGIGLGVLVSPLLTLMRVRYRIPRILSAFLFILAFAAFCALVFYSLGFIVSDQVQALVQQWPELAANLQSRWNTLIDRFPWLAERLKGVDVSSIAKSAMAPFLLWVKSGFAAVSGVLFALVIAVYTAVGAREYQEGTVQLFPKKMRPRVIKILQRCALTLRKWFRAQMLDVVIMGLLTLVGLWAVGAPYWAVFGLLTAIFGLIPYVGIFIVIVLATLVTLGADASVLPWVLGVFFITQQIEGNVILPYVMKSQVELPEVPLLILMLLMGTWFGLLGVFLATPMFAILRVLYLELYVPKVGA